MNNFQIRCFRGTDINSKCIRDATGGCPTRHKIADPSPFTFVKTQLNPAAAGSGCTSITLKQRAQRVGCSTNEPTCGE